MEMILTQQQQESDKAYAAFKCYLDLGPNRSLRQVSKDLGKDYRVIQHWAAQFQWRQRILAHSARQLQLERETADSLARSQLIDWTQRQQQQREAEWHWRTELLQVAQDIVARWRAKPERCESLASLAKILDLASKLGRLSSGLATEHQELSGPNGGAIPLEISAALDKIYGSKPALVSEPPPIDVAGTSSTSSSVSSPERGLSSPQPRPNVSPLPHSLPSFPLAPSDGERAAVRGPLSSSVPSPKTPTGHNAESTPQ